MRGDEDEVHFFYDETEHGRKINYDIPIKTRVFVN